MLGLTFRQHHTLHMQQVLRAYERLPPNPADRVALYTGLFELAKDLDEDETSNLELWLRNGGEFPAPTPRNQHLSMPDEVMDLTRNNEQEDEQNDWPDYHPEDFAFVASEMEQEDFELHEEGENLATDNGRGREQEGSEEDESDNTDDNSSALPQAPNSLKGKSATEIVECLICAESYVLAEFPPSTQITSTCNHKNDERVCIYCLHQSIETAVTEGQLNLVVCPFCPEKLSRDEVKRYATNEIFARYFCRNLVFQLVVLTVGSRYDYLAMIATPDLVMCLGLNCGSGQIHAGDNPMMICQVCSFKTCAIHKLPWHAGQTCEEFDMDESQIDRLEQAEATAKLLAKERAQVCPNCHQGVSRSEGCDHMTCKFPL